MKAKYFLFMYLLMSVLATMDNVDRFVQNTVGSYTCSCYSGYELNTDAQRCAGMWSLFKLLFGFHNVTSVLHVILVT